MAVLLDFWALVLEIQGCIIKGWVREGKSQTKSKTVKNREQTGGYQRKGGLVEGWNRWRRLRVNLSWWVLSNV